MSIELHCPGCGSLIRAPDNAGGKRGKCPHCERTVYIPTVSNDDDVIPLAPIDPTDEARDDELRREATQYTATISKAGEGGAAPGAPASRGLSPGQVVDVKSEVESYIRAMHGSKLDQAESVVRRLRSVSVKAQDVIQGMIVDELQPSIEGVPPPLVQGFLKSLLGQLK